MIDKIPPLISKQLLRIKVRGSFEKVEVSKEPVPIITEPLKEFLKTMKGKQK